MDPILHSSRGSDARMAALSAFWSKHANSQTFTEYPGDTKKALAEELSSVLEASQTANIVPSEELSMGLRILRVMSREDLHMESLHNTNAVEWCMRLGELMEGVPAPISDSVVIEEARKCLVNIVVKKESFLAAFVEKRGPWRCLELLKETLQKLQAENDMSGETKELEIKTRSKLVSDFGGRYDGILVPVVRLLFSVTRPLESNKALTIELREMDLLDTVAEYLFIYSFVFQREPMTTAVKLHVQDLMRIVVNLTFDLGALGSSDLVALAKYIPRFPRLIHAMHRFFEIPCQAFQDPIYQLHITVASCFVNVPHQVAGALLMDEDGSWPPAEKLVPRIARSCQTLCNVLMESIKLDKPRAFVPLLMWMSNYAKGVNSVKTAFLAIMFPNRDLDAESQQTESPSVAPPGNDADTVGNAIIGHMCSIEMAVKHWSNELMYIIVDEDADKFVRLTGFGNSAGHLVNRGLFGLGSLSEAKTTRADVEAMTGRSLGPAATSAEATPASRAAPSISAPDAGEVDSDEEEEKARQLMMRLEDMERRGLVKLVRKGDPQPDANGNFPKHPDDGHSENGQSPTAGTQ